MFNRLDSGSSKEILEIIEKQNPNLVETIRHLMFVFEDLLLVDVNQLKEILARVDRKALTFALKGTSDQLKDHFFATMSARAVEMMKDDMEAMGPVRLKDVDEAQMRMVNIAKDLANKGEIMIAGGSAEDELVY